MALFHPRLLALLAMALTVSIYGGQFVSVRLGYQSDLTPYDIAALRFLFAGVVMLPFFLTQGGLVDCMGMGWRRGLAIVVLGGAPLTVFSNIGLGYAPAAHAAAIQPGMVAVTATLFAYLSAGRRVPGGVVAGFAVVLGGLAAIALAGSRGEAGQGTVVGDLIFIICGLAWGFFTSLCARWKVGSLAGAAVVSTVSMLTYVPIYVAFLTPRIMEAPWSVILFHGINQGLLNVVVGILLWTYGTRVLGVAVAARFPPVIPVLGTLIGIPVLGEVPGPVAAIGVVAIVAGLAIVAIVGARAARRLEG
ncbi:DMT family transporter [Phreatobacter aquaticus]|nr:DMT family transporter [Phreatobacter aquaticus]